MSLHLNDGQLRAALDGELSPPILLEHLEQCSACRSRQARLRAQIEPAARRLAFLGAQTRPALSNEAALYKFHTQTNLTKETSMFKRLFASTLFRTVAAAALLLALVISIPSTRALADQLLSLFRVQQVTVVPVDFTGMQQLTGNSAIGQQISALISDSTVITQKSGDPQSATDAADAAQKAGFAVRLPGAQSPTQINVMGATSFNFTVNRTKAQAVLDEAGRKDLVLPAAIDGAVINVHIPASVSASFGVCPAPSADGKSASKTTGSMGRQYPDCLILSELPSPLVTAPAGVDVAQLAQIGFEFSGMTSEQAAAFSKSVDWTSTLVVPIPRNAASVEQVSVDGVSGTLIKRPADDAPEFVLLWVKNGVIYSIGGLGADIQKALDLAGSLK
jgi:anti-sigma factor RsiW